MRNTLRALLLSIVWFLVLSPQAASTVEESWGKWEDDSGAVYEFLPKNEFRFSGVTNVLVPLTGTARITGRIFGSSGQYVAERHSFSGAWETGPEVCASGNLKLYVGSLECCMEAKRLGQTLVLRVLSSKGEGAACVSRTLREVNSEPNAPEK